MPGSFRFSMVVLFGVAVVASWGCSGEEGIDRYTVPKPKPVQAVAPGPMPGHPPMMRAPQVGGDRMFGAIVLRGDSAWFFKATGSRDTLAPHAEKLIDFVKSIKFREDGTPSWSLPEGWTEKPGDQFRYATLVLGVGASAPEFSVSALPKNDEDGPYILANVNRWRGQLKLPPTDAQRFERESLRIPLADDNTATVVVLAAEEAAGATPPAADVASGASGKPLALKYEAPQGWTDDGAKGERKASLSVVERDRKIDIAVTSFPASAPEIANPISNVNRWRGQIGLAAASPEEIVADGEEVEIDGRRSLYVELYAPDEANAEKATFAAMFRAGDDVWFVKLSGDGAIAKGQRDAFKKFLSSIRLKAAGEEPKGASDGK